jgi:hypothetical protein
LQGRKLLDTKIADLRANIDGIASGMVKVLNARASILAGNAAMDLTSAVVGGLDAKITTIPLGNKAAPAPKRRWPPRAL